jgi:hypothetical protein
LIDRRHVKRSESFVDKGIRNNKNEMKCRFLQFIQFQQQKRKITAEFDEQKQQILENFDAERKQIELQHKRNTQELNNQIEQIKSEHHTVINDLQARNRSDMKQQAERVQIEKEEWQTNFMKKIEKEVSAREKVFKEKLIKERDQEIEMVIQRLESETDSSQNDISRSFRMEIQRLKTDAAQQSKQLRDQHSLALDKILMIQGQLTQIDQDKKALEKKLLLMEHQNVSQESVIAQQKDELFFLKTNKDKMAETICIEL